jgi:hypothetical protein
VLRAAFQQDQFHRLFLLIGGVPPAIARISLRLVGIAAELSLEPP